MKNQNNAISFNCISKHRAILMGLAIISILFFHFTEDCVNNSYNLYPFITLYKNNVGSCGVDIFLFLSGLGLYYSFKKNPELNTFYKKRFLRILLPYFLVATPAWFVKDILLFDLGVKQFLKDVFFLSFFESGAIWFWYILMMGICYLIFPYVFEYIDSPGSKAKMANIFIFITVIAMLLQLYNVDFFNKINIALLRFPAFFAGCFIGKASYDNKKISIDCYVLIILSILILPLKNNSGVLLYRYILGLFGIASFILIAIILELLSSRNIKLAFLQKIIEWFGNYSLELYLTHVALRAIMAWVNLPTYRVRYELLLIALSILFSIVVKRLTNFIVKRL